METGFFFESVALHRDPRGLVLEPLDRHVLPHQNNAHLVITQPGAVRGNHYHERGSELSVILGPALVRVRDGDRIQDIAVPEDQAYRFFFPPGLPHAIQNTGQQPMVLIAFNSVAHDPAHPDVVRDRLIG